MAVPSSVENKTEMSMSDLPNNLMSTSTAVAPLVSRMPEGEKIPTVTPERKRSGIS